MLENAQRFRKINASSMRRVAGSCAEILARNLLHVLVFFAASPSKVSGLPEIEDRKVGTKRSASAQFSIAVRNSLTN